MQIWILVAVLNGIAPQQPLMMPIGTAYTQSESACDALKAIQMPLEGFTYKCMKFTESR